MVSRKEWKTRGPENTLVIRPEVLVSVELEVRGRVKVSCKRAVVKTRW